MKPFEVYEDARSFFKAIHAGSCSFLTHLPWATELRRCTFLRPGTTFCHPLTPGRISVLTAGEDDHAAV